jgi:GNAT superfamily N-acetyltransferase
MEMIKLCDDDLPSTMNLLKRVRMDLHQKGVDLWGDDDQSQFSPQDSIIGYTCFGLKDDKGKLMGIITLSEDEPPTYGNIPWKKAKGKTLTLNGLFVDPVVSAQGAYDRLLEYAEEFARENGYSALRTHAHTRYKPFLYLLLKREYKSFGSFLQGHCEYRCFQKILAS